MFYEHITDTEVNKELEKTNKNRFSVYIYDHVLGSAEHLLILELHSKDFSEA